MFYPHYPHYYDMPIFVPSFPGEGQHTWPGSNDDWHRRCRRGGTTQARGTRTKRQTRKRMRRAQSASSRRVNRK